MTYGATLESSNALSAFDVLGFGVWKEIMRCLLILAGFVFHPDVLTISLLLI